MKKNKKFDTVQMMRDIREKVSEKYWRHPDILKKEMEAIRKKYKKIHILSTKLSRHLFWDVDFDSIHWDKKYQWIIVRVFERGDVEDIRQCRRYYGDEKVKVALLSAKYIMKHRLPLASAVINEPLAKFRCYTLQQSLPPHYLY